MRRRCLLSRSRWTHAEISKLKLIMQGIHGITLENRTKSSIQYKIRALKLKKDRTYEIWTQEEIELLKSGGQIKGRSDKTIDRKRQSLKLYKREPRFEWPDVDIQILRKACSEGMSALKIYNMHLLPDRYSKNSIQKKICRLGLAKKNRKYKKFNNSMKLIFQNFLTDNWMGKLPEELAQIWNQMHNAYPVSPKRVIQYLTDLGIKVSCYEMGYIRRMKQYEQLQKMNTSQDNLVFVNERIRARRVKMMARRFSNNKDIWTGLDMKVPIDMNEDD